MTNFFLVGKCRVGPEKRTSRRVEFISRDVGGMSSDDLQTFQMSGWWYDGDLLGPSVQRRDPWRHKLAPADNSEDVSMISQTGCTVVG